jgi:hypothetical protein
MQQQMTSRLHTITTLMQQRMVASSINARPKHSRNRRHACSIPASTMQNAWWHYPCYERVAATQQQMASGLHTNTTMQQRLVASSINARP